MGESHVRAAVAEGEVMGTKLITYECVAAAHQPSANGADKLTIHDHEWAFCAFDARADGHEWRRGDAEAFDVLLRHAGLPANLDHHEVHAKA
jgi:hypothetical protein